MFNKNKITLETRENKMEKIKKKGFRKTLFTTVMSMGVLLGCTGMLVGCGEAGPKGDTGAQGPQGEQGVQGIQGVPGVAGSMWFTGTAVTGTGAGIEATVENTKVGDIYFNTTTCDLYQCVEENTWNWLSNLKGDQGDQGIQGEQGQAGKDGTSVYVGYDGYIWSGTTKTEFKAENVELGENVIENTIGIENTMSDYFEGDYIDLSTNTIALMANYMPNAKLTQFGGAVVTEIKVVAEEAGELYIGSAKVADIVNARTTGATYTATTTAYEVEAGLNTITFTTPLELADDETIVLGGNGSVGLYQASGITVEDEAGNYTLVNNQANADIICTTSDVQDTLAIQVSAKYEEILSEAIFDGITTEFPASMINTTDLKTVNDSAAPFKYQNLTLLSGKTITKIGLPVLAVTDAADPFITVYKIKTSTTKLFDTNALETIKLSFPTTITTGTWAYADCNIELAEDETIAIGAKTGDTIDWGYYGTKQTQYSFYTSAAGGDGGASILFDIYTTKNVLKTVDEKLEELNQKEQEAIYNAQVAQLATLLNGKNFSILGDSISTFTGYSNDATNTNSTIGSNAVYYSGSNCGITSVDMTWWKQIADDTNMNVLVNNSWSGDKVTGRGTTRCTELHDDTGTNANTNPDIIAVYLGINDFDQSVTVSNFETSYNTMIESMVNKYTAADVYLFTLVPNKTRVDDATMQQYNAVIKEAAETYGCNVVDLYADSGITYDNCSDYMGDGSGALHPNPAGMDLITECFKKVLLEKYVINE
ncbi:MAG: hypothetical protein IJZ26_03325 [Clostridia bacterium]|nr:hypothetical protein [Clostridia bacterium]